MEAYEDVIFSFEFEAERVFCSVLKPN